nr:VOC family protein [Neolewinella litorea]
MNTMQPDRLHHIAIICSDYGRSKRFYTEVLGLEIVREVYREESAPRPGGCGTLRSECKTWTSGWTT